MSINPPPKDYTLLEQLFENSFDSSWVISLRNNFKIEYVNKLATEELVGYSQEILNQHPNFWLTVIHPEDKESVRAAVRECWENRRCELKHRIFHKNGKMKWVISRLKMLSDDEGNPFRIIGSSMDVTAATLNELELKASEELFQSLANYAPIGIFRCDINGSCIYVNRQWSEIAGMDPQEAMDNGWGTTLAPADHDRVIASWVLATSEKKAFSEEFNFLNPTKGLRYVCSRAVPVTSPDGKILGFVGTVEDITDRKHSEQTLIAQQQKLVASAKMSSLGEMASGIAHEINNPLMIITGTCTKMRRSLSEKNTVECEKEISRVEATAFRISKIIKALKSFSRNAENDMKETVSIERLIEETIELCGQRFENEKIQVTKNLQSLGEIQVNVRPTQVVQVLLNLLSNSFDAIEKLNEKWVDLSVEKTQHALLVKVTDSGPGIPDHLVERIMEPFFTTKEVGKGTGLGLSISRGMMEENGGKLLYMKGRHTCFALEFLNVED